MSINSEQVKLWRKNCKTRIVEAMGGKCCICSYNKCNDALALHHLDPNKKNFSFGGIRANPISWKKIVEELRKCILICHNCHSEFHSGMISIPDDAIKFNEAFNDYRLLERSNVELNPCPVCGKLKPTYKINCSTKCSSKSTFRVPWKTIDLEKEIIKPGFLISKLAEKLGCSSATISRRIKKLGK